ERAACRADVLLVWHPWLFHHHAPPEAQRVPDEPGFLNLAAPHATDDDPCHGQWLASRAAAEQSALMCAACRPADHHLVLFGDLILDGDVEIGEGGAIHGNNSFDALGA